MKAIFFASIFSALLFANCSDAQSESNPPAVVKQAFEKQYPDTKAKWDKEGENYEAEFKQNGQEISTVYSATGALVETEVEIAIADLPAGVADYVKANYKDAKIKEASKITKANGDISYEAEVNGKDLMFDAGGKFLAVDKD